jgi:hypothetical protein
MARCELDCATVLAIARSRNLVSLANQSIKLYKILSLPEFPKAPQDQTNQPYQKQDVALDARNVKTDLICA